MINSSALITHIEYLSENVTSKDLGWSGSFLMEFIVLSPPQMSLTLHNSENLFVILLLSLEYLTNIIFLAISLLVFSISLILFEPDQSFLKELLQYLCFQIANLPLENKQN